MCRCRWRRRFSRQESERGARAALGLQDTPAALGTLACSDINAASKRGMNFRKMFTSYFPSLKKTKLEEIVQFE